MSAEVRIGNKMQRHIHFCRFVQETGLEPGEVACILTLANKVRRAAERQCNEPGFTADRQREALEDYCHTLGAQVMYPGLWPMIVMGGRQFHLPSL